MTKIYLKPLLKKQKAEIFIMQNIINSDDKNRTIIFAFNKPKGVICSHKDERHRSIIYDFIPSNFLKEAGGRVHSIGRLDYNSQGLLLLTNNSKLKNYFENPKSKIIRIYKVKVQGIVERKHKERILEGITIKNIKYKVVDLRFLNKTKSYTWLRITLDCGKNQHIRKIFSKFNMTVNKLIRIQYGPYKLANLNSGEVKILKKKRYK